VVCLAATVLLAVALGRCPGSTACSFPNQISTCGIGHGHVHVIHHVHHYSTSSHDVDDLPDVIGDDDASLPPEYRHGDMSIGGDDDSLPPEYRDGDMSIADVDESLSPEYRQGDISIGSDEESLPSEYRHGDATLGGDEESLPPEYRDGDSMSGDDSDGSPPRKLSALMRGRAPRGAIAFDCTAGSANWKNWPDEKRHHCCKMEPAICI